MKTLLVVKSAAEILAGLVFAFLPSLTMSILFGAQLETAAGVLACRIIGAPIFTLGLACWLARNDGRSPAAAGLVKALLLYDLVFIVMLLLGRVSVGSALVCGLWCSFIQGSRYIPCFASGTRLRLPELPEIWYVN